MLQFIAVVPNLIGSADSCAAVSVTAFLNTAVESLNLQTFSFKLLNTSRTQTLQIFSDSISKIYLEHLSTL